jgi:hypothetical protein
MLLTNSDVLCVRNRDAEIEAANRIVETQFVLVDELEDDSDDESFRVAADAEMVGGRQPYALCHVLVAERANIAAAFAVPDADEDPRYRRASAMSLRSFSTAATTARCTAGLATDVVTAAPRAIDGARAQTNARRLPIMMSRITALLDRADENVVFRSVGRPTGSRVKLKRG